MNRRQAALTIGGIGVLAGGGMLLSAYLSDNKKCICDEPERKANNPLERRQLHVCAFHLISERDKHLAPNLQLESHHYCTAVNANLHQCIIYDTDKPNARIIGVEYIVNKSTYEGLPDNERSLWHPHKYEISAGLLTCPGLPRECEDKLMAALLDSWGKTWHTCPDINTPVPMGSPLLMWSATADGQVRQNLIEARDRRYCVNINEIRNHRKKLNGRSN